MFRTETFNSFNEIKEFYNSFCNTFVVLTFWLFKRCFKSLLSKGIDIKTKLLRETAISVVARLK